MKKLFALLLAAVMVFSLVACAKPAESAEVPVAETAESAETTQPAEATDSDLAYVQEKGTLVVGITEFEPMDYQDESGEWIGFDADMAKAFAESLGVNVEFQVIDWDNKVLELDGKSIDCVWNGMTLNEETLSAMSCSNPYCNNYQVVVLPVSVVDNYKTVESLSELAFAAENGSAGQKELEALGYSCTPVADQATALLEVSSGTADAAVIDALMAGAMVGDGTSYDDLTYSIGLNADEGEQYGVGFRTGSDLAEALNDFFAASYANGTMQTLADTYGIQAAIVAQD